MQTKLRPANKGDLAFVTSAWVNTARNCPQFTGVPNNVFYHWYQHMMERVAPRATVLLLSVDDPEIPDDRSNIGFAVYEKTSAGIVLHFMFVKSLFRGQGFAKRLWAAIEAYEMPDTVVYTLATKKMSSFSGKHYDKLKHKGWLYNPFELWTLRE